MVYKENSDTVRSQNAMLTDDQRRFLQSDGSGYTAQNAYGYRESIKDRVYHTILDFALLYEHWEKHDSEGKEEVMRDVFNEKDLLDGVASIISLLYTDSPYSLESGLEKVILEGVNKAERELSESDWYYVADVDVSVDHIDEIDMKNALKKFRRGKMSDMSDGEAQAIVRILHRTPVVSPQDLEEMRSELADYYDEILEERAEAGEKRAEKAMGKQMRQQEKAQEDREQ